ncbi:MAG: Gfo/Idh/MocA family oxidoreductase [Planctomycetes bacterium]|nr:Gfo/Idh/MocA family oxidoreductase [Planctomycetota bacterium]
MTRRISRRGFLAKAAGAAAAAIGLPRPVPACAVGAPGTIVPSDRIVMASIGIGSMGGYHLQTFLKMQEVQVVAVCDVREIFRVRARDRVNERYGDRACAVYDDFRELLARDDIDAIANVTPDHWHALVSIEAARNGIDMYTEKPLAMSIEEGKALRRVVDRYGVIFQFGTQQRSERGFRFACELVRNRRIGELRTILVGSHASPTVPQQPIQPVPDRKELDYDRWLGPAPWAPYTYERCASRAMGSIGTWMFVHDYGLGGLGGAWGIHHVDIAQWGNDADDTGPIEIEGSGDIPQEGFTDTPTAWEVEHLYANGVRMVHMDTRTALRRAPQFALHDGLGILFIGTEGWVLVCRGFLRADPESLLSTTWTPSDIRLPQSDDHRRNFLECVRSRRPTICPIGPAVRSDTICHLDDIAIRLGRKIRWDPERETIPGDDEAARMLERPMRSPWTT